MAWASLRAVGAVRPAGPLLDRDDLVDRVRGPEADLHVVVALGRQLEPDDVAADRQLAMAPVHQHRQADRCRAAQVADGVEGRADGPAGEQDVVDQHDVGPLDVERDLRTAQHGPGSASGPGRRGRA